MYEVFAVYSLYAVRDLQPLGMCRGISGAVLKTSSFVLGP